MTAVSIAMPVYNSEKYLSRAIDSILSQSFKDFELILIDDGSKDGSGAICDRYKSEDARVVVKHVKNGGMCRARNLAIDSAKGEYMAFCDDDDLYLPNLLEDNYRIALETDADVVRFGRELYLYTAGSSRPRVSTAAPSSMRIYTDKEIFPHYEEVRARTDGVWNGLYKRSFLNQYGIRFDERLHSGFEDNLFNIACYSTSRIVATNPGVYYRWIRRVSHSTSFKLGENYFAGLRECVTADYNVMKKNHVSSEYFGNRMVEYAVSPLGVLLHTNSFSTDNLMDTCCAVSNVFSPMDEEISACPLRVSYSIVFKALMQHDVALLKVAMSLLHFRWIVYGMIHK
ncbi:MAG: glycosyltransferase family 2 protein [Olsenella sp.]|nr:glycosyltransferase family 2 protein [Olsenella sp.]MCI1288355.1 glycosyltransferase family 2 protein [Olsenella sp.]